MGRKARKSFSEEFKANAVKMSLKPGISVNAVARELDVPAVYLSKWRREAHDSKEIGAAEARIDAISENSRLKDEVKRLKMELEILKKAAVYFASQK
jgi:transposase